MAMSEARRRANKKWNDAHMTETYDRITMLVPKGRKKTIEDRIKATGTRTLSNYLNGLVIADLGMTEKEWKGKDE